MSSSSPLTLLFQSGTFRQESPDPSSLSVMFLVRERSRAELSHTHMQNTHALRRCVSDRARALVCIVMVEVMVCARNGSEETEDREHMLLLEPAAPTTTTVSDN